MIMKISYYSPEGHYFHVPDHYVERIEKWRIEFSDFLQTLEYKHPFTQYMESINYDGELEYGIFVRCFGGDDFVDWINVEKLNSRRLYRIPEPPDDSEVGIKIDF